MEQRLIDANRLQLEPQNGAMNGVLFMGRATGKTLSLVQSCLNAMISNAPTVDAAPVVHCGECARRYTELCALYAGQMNGKDYFIQQGDDFFCKKGRR